MGKSIPAAACVPGACHEGANELVDGKAKLLRESFCDGFGDCPGSRTMEPQRAAEAAIRNSGKIQPRQVVTISREGRILEKRRHMGTPGGPHHS